MLFVHGFNRDCFALHVLLSFRATDRLFDRVQKQCFLVLR
uniref:Uncharacterized protein n=1 Tax=Gokushovirinae environmental samples TaxID=1478972 RepID=A0A2R3UAI2_9VIRU|nr:hypothetical protein [Gokushovirinae environmental samples]